MSVRLTVTQRSEASGAQGTEVVLDDAVITLGRDKSCQVVLPQQAVSRNHARICQEGTHFFLEDLGSAYGTQVNGKPLPKGEKRLLRNGDIIVIAQYDVRFDEVKQLNGDVTSDKTSFIARGILTDVLRGDAERYLRIMNGPREGERIEISDAKEIVFGRDEKEADVVLKDDLVSRKHVKVRRDWSGTHVEDLGSRNGIKVNKKRVNRKALKDRDELEVGGTRFLYVDPSEPPEEEAVQISTEAKAPKPPPSPQRPPSRREPKVEPPPEEPEKPVEEPPAAVESPPAEEPAPAEEPPPPEEPSLSSEQPMPDEEPAPDKLSHLKDKGKLVPLVVMGVVGLLFLVLMIAVLAGA